MAHMETATKTNQPCWSCHQPAGEGPFCIHCATILPLLHKEDYFTTLGLDAKRMSLEPESLQETFYALSRRFHPDRYQTRSEMELKVAEERSAHLNVAYRTLSDPIARTEYLLELEEGSPEEAQGQPQAELLVEIMELQETVEAFWSSKEAERGALEESLREAHGSLEARREEIEAELHEAFGLWDRRVVGEGSQETKDELLVRFRDILHRGRYLTTTIRDVEAALAGQPPPERDGG